MVTGTPERIPAQTFAALCDILGCTLNDLFEPYVQMRAAETANSPKRPEDLGIIPCAPIPRRIRVLPPDEDRHTLASSANYMEYRPGLRPGTWHENTMNLHRLPSAAVMDNTR